MKLFSEDILLLKELFKTGKTELYFFHEKFMLSPAQLARSLRKFENEGLLIVKEKQVSLTDVGKEWIFENRKNLFVNEREKYWKKVPENMKVPQLGINQLYKPERKKIDKEIFLKLEDGNKN